MRNLSFRLILHETRLQVALAWTVWHYRGQFRPEREYLNTIRLTVAAEDAESRERPRDRPVRVAALTLLLLALTLGVYYPALHAQLVADDFVLVGQIDFAEASRFFHDTFGFGRNEYRPITALSYAVDGWLWGDSPAGFHLTNLLLHALAAILFFINVRALTGDTPLGFVAAGVFAIHPINHSRVAWISARDATVCAVFLLSALWLFVLSRRNGRRALHAIAGALAGCALFAYEGAVILPVLFLGADFLFLAQGSRAARLRTALRGTSLFWVIAAGYLCLWQIMFSARTGGYDLTISLVGIAQNYGSLLYRLSYGHRRVAYGLAYVLVLALCHKTLLRRRRVTAFALLLILVSFVPYSVISGFADRFGYLSAFGFALLLATCFVGAWRDATRLRRNAVLAMAGLLCVFYIVEIRKSLRDWNAAGAIAARIVDDVQKQYTSLPPGSVIVLKNVPKMHGRALVFPTGLEAAIQRRYSTPVSVRRYEEHTGDPSSPLTHTLEYLSGAEMVKEVGPSGTQSAP